jgi:hypothetical protein
MVRRRDMAIGLHSAYHFPLPNPQVPVVPSTVWLGPSMLGNLLFFDPKRNWNIFQPASDHQED